MNKIPRRSIVILPVVLLAVASGWWILGRSANEVAVPNRVCDSSLSGESVRRILPDSGEGYVELDVSGFDVGDLGSRVGSCWISAGGVNVELDYSFGGRLNPSDVAQRVSRDGAVPVTLGESAYGWHSAAEAQLVAECDLPEGEGFLYVETTHDAKPDDERGADLASFTADALRFLSERVIQCPRDEPLALGDPEVGTVR